MDERAPFGSRAILDRAKGLKGAPPPVYRLRDKPRAKRYPDMWKYGFFRNHVAATGRAHRRRLRPVRSTRCRCGSKTATAISCATIISRSISSRGSRRSTGPTRLFAIQGHRIPTGAEDGILASANSARIRSSVPAETVSFSGMTNNGLATIIAHRETHRCDRSTKTQSHRHLLQSDIIERARQGRNLSGRRCPRCAPASRSGCAPRRR